jgi:hypothetical protein
MVFLDDLPDHIDIFRICVYESKCKENGKTACLKKSRKNTVVGVEKNHQFYPFFGVFSPF